MCLATSTDGKWLILLGKRIVDQKRYMNWICLQGGHDCKTEKHLAIVAHPAARMRRACLLTASPWETAKWPRQKCRKTQHALPFRNRFVISLSTNCRSQDVWPMLPTQLMRGVWVISTDVTLSN